MEKDKGLLVRVYRGQSTDCTNGGITSRVDRLILIGEGVPEVFKASPSAPGLILKRHYDQWIAVPADMPEGKRSMMGGNFVYTSDSRFHNITPYPIPVYDRLE